MSPTLAPTAQLHPTHCARLQLAVDFAVRHPRHEVIFTREQGPSSMQLVWYRGRERQVILAGEGAVFERLAHLAQAEFVRRFSKALNAPVGAVLERGAGEDAMEAARR